MARVIALALTWYAYNTGAVMYNVVARVPRLWRSPSLVETAAVFAAMVGTGLALPGAELRNPRILVALFAGSALVGALLRGFESRPARWTSAGSGDFFRIDDPQTAARVSLWQRWKNWAHELADFQARLLITIAYFTAVAPIALFLRLTRDPLRLKRTQEMSHWLPRPPADEVLEASRRQFE